MAVKLPRGGSLSIAQPLLVATVVLLGPTTGAIVAGLSCIPATLFEKDRALIKGVFNSSQLTLTYLASGWVYMLLGGEQLIERPLAPLHFPEFLIPVLALAIVTFSLNSLLVGIVVSLASRARFLSIWRSNFSWTIPTQLALAVLGFAMAQVTSSQGLVGLALFAIPLVVSRQIYQRYLRLRDAYADTTRSLVAIIEAKDAYTRGHSERVARYAIAVAGRLGLDDVSLERLELAALLHDLGKVGISKRILSKPERLDAAEFAEIALHPDIGAKIIESVPFLQDLAPVVRYHHERLDGRGYGEGRCGTDIPWEARILAVADSYDAMTSSRPYRQALTMDEALDELKTGAGSQFDPDVVRAIVDLIEEERSDEAPATVFAKGATSSEPA